MKVPTQAAADVALAGLHLASSEHRTRTLRTAFREVRDWDGWVQALERHGVLGVVLRNLRRAQCELPPDVARFADERLEALAEDARRFLMTLERLVQTLARREIQPTLLKGASLLRDLYPGEALRGMGDIDLWIDGANLPAAVEAGAAAGLVPGESSFPIWWYRLAHFHLKLRPGSPLLREVEVHWSLQHPSLLVGGDPHELRARRVPVEVGGARVWTLDPLDRLLHLVTHLASHAHGRRFSTRDDLRAVLTDGDHPLRLKWVLDVLAESERLGIDPSSSSVRERAREWGALAELDWVFAWIRTALGFEGEAADRGGELSGTSRDPSAASRPAHEPPLAGFEFRAATFARLPRWIWPPRDVFQRRFGPASPQRRLAHAGAVLGRCGLAALALPVAWLGRELLRSRRRRALAEAGAPERVLDQVAALRTLERKRNTG